MIPPRPAWVPESAWQVIVSVHTNAIESSSPIDFYARVIDQEGQPVPIAKFTLETAGYDGNALKEKTIDSLVALSTDAFWKRRTNLISDVGGLLSFQALAGHSLSVVAIEKDGYLSSSTENGSFNRLPYETFNYARFTNRALATNTDAASARVYQMWKKLRSEPWILRQKSLNIFGESLIYKLNLFDSQQDHATTANSDLVLTFELNASDNPKWRSYRSVTVSVPTGGIIETHDRFPYVAPSDGYQPRWNHDFTPDREEIRNGLWKKTFYVRSRNGRVYASIELTFPSFLIFKSIVNPNGSRYLEPEPSREITGRKPIHDLDAQTAQP